MIKPSFLDCSKHPYFITILKNRVSARNNAGLIGSVRGEKPIPINLKLYYFEVKVEHGEEISLGIVSHEFPDNKQLGTVTGSIGYRSDAKIFYGNNSVHEYGEHFGLGDILGCGIMLESKEVFFTKNGKHLGKFTQNLFKSIQNLYPCVSLHGVGEEIRVNFGQDPYQYDYKQILIDLENEQKKRIDQIRISQDTTRAIIRDYLLFYGYSNTLHAFDNATTTTSTSTSLEKVSKSNITGDISSSNEVNVCNQNDDNKANTTSTTVERDHLTNDIMSKSGGGGVNMMESVVETSVMYSASEGGSGMDVDGNGFGGESFHNHSDMDIDLGEDDDDEELDVDVDVDQSAGIGDECVMNTASALSDVTDVVAVPNTRPVAVAAPSLSLSSSLSLSLSQNRNNNNNNNNRRRTVSMLLESSVQSHGNENENDEDEDEDDDLSEGDDVQEEDDNNSNSQNNMSMSIEDEDEVEVEDEDEVEATEQLLVDDSNHHHNNHEIVSKRRMSTLENENKRKNLKVSLQMLLSRKTALSLEDTLEMRSSIRKALREGRVEDVFSLIESSSGGLSLSKYSEAWALLQCVRFIQLLRDGQLVTAVQFAARELYPFLPHSRLSSTSYRTGSNGNGAGTRTGVWEEETKGDVCTESQSPSHVKKRFRRNAQSNSIPSTTTTSGGDGGEDGGEDGGGGVTSSQSQYSRYLHYLGVNAVEEHESPHYVPSTVVQNIVGLLAWADVTTSPDSCLLSADFIEYVADIVNNQLIYQFKEKIDFHRHILQKFVPLSSVLHLCCAQFHRVRYTLQMEGCVFDSHEDNLTEFIVPKMKTSCDSNDGPDQECNKINIEFHNGNSCCWDENGREVTFVIVHIIYSLFCNFAKVSGFSQRSCVKNADVNVWVFNNHTRTQ
eukprot:gene10968-22924_t